MTPLLAQPTFARWQPPLAVGLLAGLILFLVGRAVAWDWAAAAQLTAYADHRIYMDAAERIRAGGPVYPDWQLAGPYGLERNPELYPPPTLFYLIVPMSFLPAVLWWAIPLGVIAATVWCWRPSLLGWIGILACFVPPWSWDGIAAGGIFMWIAAFVALGTRWPVFYAGVLFKPSLFPFALLGVRSKWWRWAVLAAAIPSLAVIPFWFDYVRAMLNLQGGTLLYSIHNVPLILVPLIAYLASTRGSSWSERFRGRTIREPAGLASSQGTAPESAA